MCVCVFVSASVRVCVCVCLSVSVCARASMHAPMIPIHLFAGLDMGRKATVQGWRGWASLALAAVASGV